MSLSGGRHHHQLSLIIAKVSGSSSQFVCKLYIQSLINGIAQSDVVFLGKFFWKFLGIRLDLELIVCIYSSHTWKYRHPVPHGWFCYQFLFLRNLCYKCNHHCLPQLYIHTYRYTKNNLAKQQIGQDYFLLIS